MTFFLTPGFSETNATQLTLSVVIERTLSNNPGIRMSHAMASALDSRVRDAGGFDNPSIGTEYGFSMGDWMFQGRMMVPNPLKADIRRKAALADAREGHERASLTALDMRLEAAMAFWDYWYAYEAIDIYKSSIQLMTDIRKISESLYSTGNANQADILTVSLEIAAMQKMQIDMEVMRDGMLARLNALMTTDDKAVKPATPDFTSLTNNPSRNEADLSAHPVVLAKAYGADAAGERLSMEQAEWFPDFMLQAKYSTASGGTLMAEFEVPLFFDRKTAKIEAMEYEKKAALEAKKEAEWNLRAQRSAALSRYEGYLKILRLYESKMLPNARLAVDQWEAGYLTGKNGIIELVESQKNSLSYLLDYKKTLSELGKTVAERERFSGSVDASK